MCKVSRSLWVSKFINVPSRERACLHAWLCVCAPVSRGKLAPGMWLSVKKLVNGFRAAIDPLRFRSDDTTDAAWRPAARDWQEDKRPANSRPHAESRGSTSFCGWWVQFTALTQGPGIFSLSLWIETEIRSRRSTELNIHVCIHLYVLVFLWTNNLTQTQILILTSRFTHALTTES